MIHTNSFKPRVLATGLVGAPQVSGDGKTVVWNQNCDGNVDIYRYHDGKVDRLSSDPRQDIHPRPNYDGSVVTWSRFSTLDPNDKEGNFDVVVWRDGQEETLAGSRANESDPVVSPDGTRVAWTSDIDGLNRKDVIQTWQGGTTRNLTPETEGHAFPVFAGNDSLLWRAFDANGSDVVKGNLEDGQYERITHQSGHEVKPAGSSDGQTVVYQSADADNDDDLFRLDLKTGQVDLLAGVKKVDEDWPAVSEDGQTVAWTNFDRRGPGPSAYTQIYLHEKGENRQLTWGPGLHGQCSMSGDGNQIAFQWINSLYMDHRMVVLLEREA